MACSANEEETHPKTVPEEAKNPKEEAIDYALSMGLGWNLGNNLDAHVNGISDETSWGNPAATQKTFDAVKKAGFSTVRIPVTWMGHIGKAPGYRIDKSWLDRVAKWQAMPRRQVSSASSTSTTTASAQRPTNRRKASTGSTCLVLQKMKRRTSKSSRSSLWFGTRLPSVSLAKATGSSSKHSTRYRTANGAMAPT
ncbi:MAG: cellulase family glycosylhydrolase [Bacteroidaceae bacterium]|nr:cellulase family glycosylhydrolase [Bacteroidaceae bacterium]